MVREIFLISLALGLAACSGGGDYAVVEAGKDAVRAISKDPDAVQFGEVWAGRGTPADAPGDSVEVACGTFNAKNSFGAYTGMQRFMAGSNGVLTDEKDRALLDQTWHKHCDRWRKPA